MSPWNVLTLLLGISATAAIAQNPSSPPPKTVAQRTAAPAFAQAPFDIQVERLPANYNGHDATRIITVLQERKKTAKKGEFETTAEYQARLAGPQDKSLYGNVLEDSLLAFRVDLREPEYDADAQKMGRILANVNTEDGKLLARVADKTSERSYSANNAFGAQVTVSETRGDVYYLWIVSTGDLPGLRSYLKIDADVATAKALKGNGKGLIICKLADDPLDIGLRTNQPTRQIPVDAFLTLYRLKVNALGLWLFDAQTGRVYHKQSFT